MAAPNSSFSELLSTTIQLLEPGLGDSITNRNPVPASLKELGCIKYKDGGPQIVIPVMYQENGSFKRYDGAESLDVTYNDTMTSFNFSPKQFAINIQAHGREVEQNSGKSEHENLVASRIKVAKATLENRYQNDLVSDGTANSSKQITGFSAMIADDPTAGTYGGITRTTYSFAQNQRYRATTTGGSAMSATNIIPYMDAAWLLGAQYGAMFKVIYADDVCFRYFEGQAHALTRLTDTNSKMAKLGFEGYKYKNAEVLYVPATASGMPDTTMWFVDPDCVELHIYRARNFTRLPRRDSFSQDAFIEYIAWMGNLCANNVRKLVVLNND